MSAQRNKVSTHLGKRAFYNKDMANKERVGQTGQTLPPRCVHCRISWDTVMLHDAVHCMEHSKTCLVECVDHEENVTQCDDV